MSTFQIQDSDIPSLDGKVALITGGASGIGLAAANLMAKKGATVHIIDLQPPEEKVDSSITFIKGSTTSWSDLKAAFKQAGHVDIAVANAGVSEEENYFEDRFDEDGELIEPKYNVIEVNYRGVLNFVKLAQSHMRRQGTDGSIVITTSSTGYCPEQNLPVYSATKLGLIGLVRSLRSTFPCHGVTINAVAPNATVTKLLPERLSKPLTAAGLPVSTPEMVGRAVVFSAVAQQKRMVEPYGKEQRFDQEGRWNGRVILTLGDEYTEIEEKISDLKPAWYGWQNLSFTRQQQASADFRQALMT